MKCKFTLTNAMIIILVLMTYQFFGQKNKYLPKNVALPSFFYKTTPLNQMKLIAPEFDSATSGSIIENINNAPWDEKNSNQPFDLLLQNSQGDYGPGRIIENFQGISNLQNKIPPDTEGDVGINYYVQMINMVFAVFDKRGDIVYGPASNLSIWQEAPAPWSDHSNGDPITLYDEVAQRWMLSELSFPNHPNGPYYMKIAISETEDPTGSWYLYGYEYDYFCDYPKLGVWHDGYYLTNNNNYWDGSQWHFHAVGVSVFERDSMLVGSPMARRIFYDFYPNQQPWSVLPADFDGTPPDDDTPSYLAYSKEGNTDRIYIYKVITDWQNINNSNMQWMNSLYPESFNGSIPNGITQPEEAPYLAPMSNRLLYRLQYRNFEEYESMVTNHTVNRGDDVAGIRWYEFRNYDNSWEIYQQGTYSPDDHHRWMGSIAMDGYGNIALGYSVSSKYVYPSIRYTARSFDAPLGIMNVAENEIIEGSGVQTNPSHRWGDYSCMSVDPVDQTTFWYTQQYYKATGDRCWKTRIASFQINDILSLYLSSNNDIICVGDSVQLFANPTGGSGNYSFLWKSVPPLLVTSNQNPIVAPQVTTTFFCTLIDGVNSVSKNISIQVIPSPEVYAGPDTMFCAKQNYWIQNSIAENYSSLFWQTIGDGTFSDPYLLHPVYYPGQQDIMNGSVMMFLTAFPLQEGLPLTDSICLFIDPCAELKNNQLTGDRINLFSNPYSNSNSLVLSCKSNLDALINIYNYQGKIVFSKLFSDFGGSLQTQINLDFLNQGVYVANFIIGKKRTSLKFIVL